MPNFPPLSLKPPHTIPYPKWHLQLKICRLPDLDRFGPNGWASLVLRSGNAFGPGQWRIWPWAQTRSIFVGNLSKYGQQGARGSDCCDHCLLFKQSIMPGIRKMPSVAGPPLVAICPSYSDAFDEQAPSIEDDPVSNLQKFFHYTKTHDVKRQEDRSSLSRDWAWNHGLRRTGLGLGGQLNIS